MSKPNYSTFYFYICMDLNCGFMAAMQIVDY